MIKRYVNNRWFLLNPKSAKTQRITKCVTPVNKITGHIILIVLTSLHLTCLSVGLAQPTVSKTASARKPNIIYIYADDLGYAELGSYGQEKIRTPHLDRLAKEGIRFTQHYTSAPVCAPARCMLLTGKHGGHSYIRGNYELGGYEDETEGGQMPLPEGTYTIGKMLKQAGYKTALCGKWGLGMHYSTGSPLKQGFDYYYGYLDQKQAHNYYPSHLWENDQWAALDNPKIDVHKRVDSTKFTDRDFDSFKGRDYAPTKITEKALAFIDNNMQGPFFLYLPYTTPHVALQVPDEYVKKYLGLFNERPYYGQRGYSPSKYPLSTYAAMVTCLDDQVGLIMQKVKALGLDENTIIMFSSDNGTTFTGGVKANYFNSVGGLRGLKMDLFEGGIREPFIARWPGVIRPGTTSELIIAQYDLMATLAELTSQTVPDTDGISFLPELLGSTKEQKKHEYLFFEYPEKGGQLAIRMGDWKGVRINCFKDTNSPWQIYHLQTDVNETTDVASQHPDLVKRFNEIVAKEHRPSHIVDWEFVSPKTTLKEK